MTTGSLAQSPSYLAFLRSVGVADGEDAAVTQYGADRVQRRTARALPRLGELGGRAREQISNSHESRGLFRSGQHEVALGRQRSDEAYATTSLQDDTSDDVRAMQMELARRRAERQRGLAEAGLGAAGELYEEQY